MTSFTGTYAGIEELEALDFRKRVAHAVSAHVNEDSFVMATHFLVDELIANVPHEQVLDWLAAEPANLEYMTRYLNNEFSNKNSDAALDVIYGALYTCVEDTVTSLYDELKEAEALPWQLPTCTYCSQRHANLKGDRIGQPTCKACWDEGVDGPW